MNRSKIEWCDHTWNPVTGCRHGCSYCYARRMAARFSGDVRLNKMAKKDYALVPAADNGESLYVLDTPMLNETGNPLAYPFGFEPTLHRHRMGMPGKLKMGNNIFVGAMSDLFGEWVPDIWIGEVLQACREEPRHNYLFLTKNPGRYGQMECRGALPANSNFWYGSTLTAPDDKFFISDSHNTFWSIEPILAPFSHCIWEEGGITHVPDWVIVGAETGRGKGKTIPQKEWIEEIAEWCDKSCIPIFMKDSLVPVVGEENMRREYPAGLQRKAISEKMEKKLYDICCSCGAYAKKSEMVALSARSARGEQPKQFAFMCRQCFRDMCKGHGIEIPDLAAFRAGLA